MRLIVVSKCVKVNTVEVFFEVNAILENWWQLQMAGYIYSSYRYCFSA